MRIRRLFLFGLAAFIAASIRLHAGSASAVESATPKPPFGRVVIIGASASAGFTRKLDRDGLMTDQLRLSRFFDAALLVPHEPVRSFANVLMFLSPQRTGTQQITQAMQDKPTMVVGVDFLFWFCYGNLRTNELRTERFEQGLKLLEGIECPLVLGDIPDASGADPTMLDRSEIPTKPEMAAANLRLKEWAAHHPNVILVSLSGFMRDVVANQKITVHRHDWPAGTTSKFLQDDGLHPTLAGCSVLSLAVLDAVVSAGHGVSADEVQWDSVKVLEAALLLQKTNAARLNLAPQPASTGN